MDLFGLTHVALWIVVVTQGVILFLLLRSVGTVFLNTGEGVSRDGVSVGTRAPDFTAIDAAGTNRSLRDYLGRWTVLIFASPTCQICWRLVPKLREFRQAVRDQVEVLLLLRADHEVAAAYETTTAGALPVLAIGTRGAAEKYKVRVSPFIHVLDPAGVVRAKGLVNTVENVEHLLYDAGVRHKRIQAHGEEHERGHAHGDD